MDKLLRRLWLSATLLLLLSGAGLAQDAAPPAACWQPGFDVPEGVNGVVKAMVWTRGNLYIGGYFTAVGGVAARNVARWDGQRWHSLGTGDANGISGAIHYGDYGDGRDPTRPGVWALAVAPNGDLYVGGEFSRAGTVAVRHLARWNGRQWSAVGDFLHLEEAVYQARERQAAREWTRQQQRYSEEYRQENLYHIEDSPHRKVLALAVAADGSLYAGGNFQYAASAYPADTTASSVARWNGRAWTVPGAGVPGTVYALAAASDGRVYAGGDLWHGELADPDVRGRVACWDGRAWTTIGTAQNYYGSEIGAGMPGVVHALALDPGGELYVAGESSNYGARNVARWDGRAWELLGTGPYQGVHGTINALAVVGDRVYVAGDYQLQRPADDPERGSRVAVWDGRAWQPLDPARPTDPWARYEYGSSVAALTVAPGGELYIGGQLLEKGSAPATHYLARWTGQRWDYLPQANAQGLDGDVLALAVGPGNLLYAGGEFNRAGRSPTHGLARWNGHNWQALPPGCLADSGGAAAIATLAVATDGQLYAGAQAYRQSICSLARWDGRAWHPLGTGLRDYSPTDLAYVRALVADPRGGVYVAGHFSAAGGLPTPNVARWNGRAWEALGAGLPGSGIEALAVAPSGDLYAAGEISLRQGYSQQLVMHWDGRAWHELGSIGNGDGNCASMNSGGGVDVLAVAPTGELYVGGVFTAVYAKDTLVQARNLMRWDGRAWQALTPVGAQEAADNCGGTWLRHGVRALAFAPGGALYAAGEFTQLGGVPAPRVARWDGTRWHALGPGLNGPAQALACPSDGRVVVGGQFTGFGNNGGASSHFAVFGPTACPPTSRSSALPRPAPVKPRR